MAGQVKSVKPYLKQLQQSIQTITHVCLDVKRAFMRLGLCCHGHALDAGWLHGQGTKVHGKGILTN